MNRKTVVILFTRIPVPGKTKTRMMPYLTGRDCARLHTSFLRDIKSAINQSDADLFVCYVEDEKTDLFCLQRIFGKQAAYFPQKGDGLGERMHLAISHVMELGYDACVLIGSDIPEFSAKHLKEAFSILKKKDVVFGPTKDGGYYLVGMKKPQVCLFEGQTYSHSSVLQNAVQAGKQNGLTIGFVEKLQDIDTPDDLKELRRRLKRSRRKLSGNTPFRQNTENTAHFLNQNAKISVIIPIYNEEKSIEALQRQLDPYRTECEILFVDGGSTDATTSLVKPGYTLLHSPKGRANQMNKGAASSTGDILFFLHCDSVLPDDFLNEIKQVMSKYDTGCFGIRFNSQSILMRICGIMSNLRAGCRRIMFGDQGIFIDRELFFEMGGFPVLPIMEDYQFSLNLRKAGIRTGMTGKSISTSDRRFPKGTLPRLKLMWKMHILRAKYRAGISVEQIAKEYRDVR